MLGQCNVCDGFATVCSLNCLAVAGQARRLPPAIACCCCCGDGQEKFFHHLGIWWVPCDEETKETRGSSLRRRGSIGLPEPINRNEEGILSTGFSGGLLATLLMAATGGGDRGQATQAVAAGGGLQRRNLKRRVSSVNLKFFLFLCVS